jgi:hypothetical protein
MRVCVNNAMGFKRLETTTAIKTSSQSKEKGTVYHFLRLPYSAALNKAQTIFIYGGGGGGVFNHFTPFYGLLTHAHTCVNEYTCISLYIFFLSLLLRIHLLACGSPEIRYAYTNCQ